MSKKYLEIIPEQKDGETPTEIYRKEIKDEKEVGEKLINAEKGLAGKKYTARIHYCFHNKNGRNQPCKVEILKKVDKK